MRPRAGMTIVPTLNTGHALVAGGPGQSRVLLDVPFLSGKAECGEPGSYSPHSFDPRMVRRHGVSAGWSGSGSRGARKVDRVQVAAAAAG